MTLKELSQLYYLTREIEHDEERLFALQSRARNPSIAKMSGMPFGGGGDRSVERLCADIADVEAIINAKLQLCLFERSRLERYIADIPDSLTRDIFKMRFVDGLPWVQVALSIGGGNTPDSVRKRVYRHLKDAKN